MYHKAHPAVLRKKAYICHKLSLSKVCMYKRHDKWALNGWEWQLSVIHITIVSQLFNNTELLIPCLLDQVKRDS